MLHQGGVFTLLSYSQVGVLPNHFRAGFILGRTLTYSTSFPDFFPVD